MTVKRINVIILDDHPLVCAAIENLVEPLEYIGDVHSFINSQDAFDFFKLNSIDLFIIDVNLGDNNGFDFYRRLKSHGYQGKTLFVSGNDSQVYSNAAYKLGSHGYICKSENLSLIKDALDGIINGYAFFKLNDISVEKSVKLSSRELIVFDYLMKGKSNIEIANILSLSSKTISTYKRRIFDKYNVTSIVQLINSSTLTNDKVL